MVPTAESGEGRKARERVRESGVAARSVRSLAPSLTLHRRSAAAILGAGSGRFAFPPFPRSGYFVASGLRESVGKERVRAGDPSSPVGMRVGSSASRESAAAGRAPGGNGARRARPPTAASGALEGTTWGRRGCGWLLTQTPGMRHGEPGAREGETSDDEGAPLPDAGQRRPRSSFVIQPLGGEGLGRGPGAGCPLDPRL